MDYKELPAKIAEMDINLAPLCDTIFNEAKSEIKWMEAADRFLRLSPPPQVYFSELRARQNMHRWDWKIHRTYENPGSVQQRRMSMMNVFSQRGCCVQASMIFQFESRRDRTRSCNGGKGSGKRDLAILVSSFTGTYRYLHAELPFVQNLYRISRLQSRSHFQDGIQS